MGRLFDAVAALAGIRAEINYEGQAAIELEAACDPSERGAYPMRLATAEGHIVIDPREMIRAVAADVASDTSVAAIATRFHRTLACATAAACVEAAAALGARVVVLSGGAFTNQRLLSETTAELTAAGLRVLTPERLPAGDGGISYGQAAVAAARMGAPPARGS